MRHTKALVGLVAVCVLFAGNAEAQIYVPGDPVLAIDLDGDSSFPPGESQFNATDQDSSTKYLNFGGRGCGFIVTPNFGASTIQSIQMTTANDAPERDPTAFTIYGTNDPIEQENNAMCDLTNFTEIASDIITLPDDRFAPSDIVNISNFAEYTSYLIIIDDIKDKNLFGILQVADVQLYTAVDGGGDQILASGDFAVACFDVPAVFSNSPQSEVPTNTIDGTPEAKYLNFGQANSGFIIRRADNAPVTIDGFTITTANDFPERDPASYDIFGTNDPITSKQNSDGEAENWTLVDSGTLTLTDDRFTESDPIPVANTTAYTAYRVVFPTVKTPAGANSMQLGEMTFTGEVGDSGMLGDVNCDGVVDLLDVAPFVDLVINGGFSTKADINMDGVVSLLDVAPFVDILTGG